MSHPTLEQSPNNSLQRRRFSHRHTQSTPSALPIPSLSFSSTSISSSSRTSATESTLATPVNSVFGAYIPYINGDPDQGQDTDDDLDTPTPTPSPKIRSRIPARIRSATTMLATKGTAPSATPPTSPLTSSLFRKFSLKRSESSSRPLTPPPRAKPSLAMSFSGPRKGDLEVHSTQAPRVDSMSSACSDTKRLHVNTPKPRRASQLTSQQTIMSLGTSSLPASPLRKTTLLPAQQTAPKGPPSRSEHLLRSALLKDDYAHENASTSPPPFSAPKGHRRRHSHATASASAESSPLLFRKPNSSQSHFHLQVPVSPSLPSGRNTPTPRPASPIHTRSAPVTHTKNHTRLHPRSPSHPHHSDDAARFPLTPHEQVLRARLERVLSAGSVDLPAYGPYSGYTSSSGDSYKSGYRYESYHEEDYSVPIQAVDLKNAEKRRKRASAPVGASGFLGWLWRSSENGEDETSDVEEFFNPLPTPETPHRRNRESANDAGSGSAPHTPRNHLNTPPNASPSRVARSPGSPSRLRSHTQPLPSSPYTRAYAHSPKPKHAFSLGTVPSMDDLAAAAAADADAQERTRPSSSRPRMPTPPPSPPRAEDGATAALYAEAESDSPMGLESEDESARKTPSRGRANSNQRSSERSRRSSQSVNSSSKPIIEEEAETETPLPSGASSNSNTSVRKAQGRTSFSGGRSGLGLGRPGRTSEDAPAGVDLDIAPEADGVIDSRPALAPLLLSPISGPTSASSTTSSFNARTASLQCRQIDGYVSFAAIDGLGEPPSSALPLSADDANSMLQDDPSESQSKGWVERLFRR